MQVIVYEGLVKDGHDFFVIDACIEYVVGKRGGDNFY